MISRSALVSTLALSLASGCGNAASTASTTSAAASASAPAMRPSASAPAASSAAATPLAPTASATAAAFVESSEPELEEWGKAREIKVPGSGKNGCETKLVREWLRVMCVNRSPELGPPTGIEVDKGRKAKERSKGENLHAVSDITTLILPVRPGSDYSATFYWANGSHVLTASWAEGTPDSARTIAFDNPADPETKPVDGAAPEGAGAAPAPEPPIDDVAALADPPKDEEWVKAPEVRFAGSSAAGCETKVLGDWFRARCANPDKAVDAIVPVKGHHKTQTKVLIEGGTATFLTPYVEGTETWARFKSGDTQRTLVLRWKKGPRPSTAGSFEGGK